jgi:tripartite-type tricarboxylate transporter receptor subunit TctC
VRADAPYKDVKDLLAAIKANPGKFKASGTGQGGIWHLAIAGLLRDQKIDPAAVPWVPSNGAAPGLQDMVAGGIEIAPVSLPEARSLIDAGKVKSLAIMNDKPSALYPNVPTLKAATGSDWTMAAWRGIVAPKGMPAEARQAQPPCRRWPARTTPTSWPAAASACLCRARRTSPSSWPSRTPNSARR